MMGTARSGQRCILSIDQGSSSLKTAVYEVGTDSEQRLLEGGIERLGTPDAALRLRDYRGSAPRETSKALNGATPIAALLEMLHEQSVHIDGVGHRLVFGGSAHEAPARVTAELMTSLDALVAVDPLHLPSALATIREIEAALPAVSQVVCFDTAFHHRMPMVAQRLPLPRELWSEGVRRYGFHGLSYESIVRELGDAGTHGRMVVAHLGNGASLAAIRDGTPVDTTMGFSPLGGLMMGTRPGDLDPGALLYLLRAKRYTVAELDDVLNHRSGLLGVSQCSADMHTLLDRRADDVAAAEAVELFVYEAKKHIGALVAVLGGLDTLVFTGGMGEHSAAIRSEIAAGLVHLGVELDPVRNAAAAPIISVDEARVTVRMIPANEDLMVARHTFARLFASSNAEADRISMRDSANGAPREGIGMSDGKPDTLLYPWQLDPKLAPAIWGGGELVREYGKHGDPHAKIGESWECWDTDTVTNGALEGSTIATLRERLGAEFLGDLDPTQIFPVLTKIITAHDWLSVQVHPNDAYAQRVEHQLVGKTECWYVMAARAGAELVVGWTRDASRAEYEKRVANGTLAEILRKVPVKAGDTVYVPAGMVHAIGPGVTVFETQQASDLTYRLFDWNRAGLDGKPRELNVAKAADVLDYHAGGQSTLAQIDYQFEGLERTALIADRRFTVERIIPTPDPASIATDGRPLMILSLEHPLQVDCAGGSAALRSYQTVLVPAGAGSCSVRSAESQGPFLFVTPARSPDQLATRLLASGIAQSRIDGFNDQFLSPTSVL